MPEALERVNILLVDDEPRNLLALESVLATGDWNLVHASSGPAALRRLLQTEFAVILLDVKMPGMDGFETAELIRGREQSRDTPIIFLTAVVQGEASVARGYSLGAVDYIFKPFDPDILRSKVAAFVELHRKTQQVRQQADQLAETTALLNSVLESATEYAITALDLDGRFLSWNEGARRIYGYISDEVIGRRDLSLLFLPDDVKAGGHTALLKRAPSSVKSETAFLHRRKNGRRFNAAVSVAQRRDANGQLIGYLVISRDITQLKRAEEERAQLIKEQAARAEAEAARDQLQQVLDVMPEAIVIADAKGSLYMSNAAARELCGEIPASVQDLVGSPHGWLTLEGSPHPLEELPIMRALRGEVVRGGQLIVVNRSAGRQAPVLVSSAPLRAAGGQVQGAVASFQDISAIKDLERQKDDFLAAASHDLRSPLAAIKARAQLLRRRASRLDSPDAPFLVEGLTRIDQVVKQIAGLISELLDVAHLQMGKTLLLEAQPTDLVDLAREVASDLQPTSDRHQIRVESDEPEVRGEWDRHRLERVLVNLVSNAIKYSPSGGPITLKVAPERADGARWAVIQVTDRGIGIPPAELPRVFEPYFRGSNVAGSIEGTGLGLSGVRQIVEQHGGRVTVDSQEGVGSTFSIRLPSARQPVQTQDG